MNYRFCCDCSNIVKATEYYRTGESFGEYVRCFECHFKAKREKK